MAGLLLAVAVNAFATGALSAPLDRYEARIVWLLPLAAALGLAPRFGAALTDAERVRAPGWRRSSHRRRGQRPVPPTPHSPPGVYPLVGRQRRCQDRGERLTRAHRRRTGTRSAGFCTPPRCRPASCAATAARLAPSRSLRATGRFGRARSIAPAGAARIAPWPTCYHPPVFLIAGLVKGVAGFGLPTVAIALLALVRPLPEAMALMLVPSLATNLWQALAGGQLRAVAPRIGVFLACSALATFAAAGQLARADALVLSGVLGLILVASALALAAPSCRRPRRAPNAGWGRRWAPSRAPSPG